MSDIPSLGSMAANTRLPPTVRLGPAAPAPATRVVARAANPTRIAITPRLFILTPPPIIRLSLTGAERSQGSGPARQGTWVLGPDRLRDNPFGGFVWGAPRIRLDR